MAPHMFKTRCYAYVMLWSVHPKESRGPGAIDSTSGALKLQKYKRLDDSKACCVASLRLGNAARAKIL